MSSSSSSPLAATSTTSNDASQSTSPSTGNGTSPPSSTLYLLTFLATLFVLLFVSCAIVLRSFFLRRRLQRLYEEQIAAGLLPSDARYPGRRGFGEQPKLWDLGLEPLPHEEWAAWDHISPLAAKHITHASSYDNNFESLPRSTTPARRGPFSHLLVRHRPPTEPPSSDDHPKSETYTRPSCDINADIHVAVFITMPARRSLQGEGIPDMVIGVSQVPMQTDDP
ncbi:hypothetical protein PHLCEN_2v9514 [Hermanssonia centrifuga]|uniref:Uncharacterized protein n=1 Tax=Hermanssonia centrifuga TaxID=98765 RepID=A0A2R6NQF6_9APHY|nr:hypothetical protein PHLCEN_2v9514 [Hermanssonia centrifuga]